MQNWLIEISFGPVQSFIEAARKSRDLFAGSFILSEVVRAAAKQLVSDACELIYPIKDRVYKHDKTDISNLSNILLVQCSAIDESTVRVIVENAILSGRNKLSSLAETARDDYKKHGILLRQEIFNYQISDALEIYATWVEIKEDYKKSYNHAKQSISARKNTRDFSPMFPFGNEKLGYGIPKSSFDGLRESVLPSNKKYNSTARVRFDLKEGEQLDALGAVKRWIALKEEQTFLPLSRIAAQGWLLELDTQSLHELTQIHQSLVDVGLTSRIRGTDIFPYDGTLLFTETVSTAISTVRKNGEAGEEILVELQKILQKIVDKGLGRPCPYVAMIMADGDRMGVFVDRALNQHGHGQISSAVSAFAEQATLIAKTHDTQTIYAGGEDLLMIAPLYRVVEMSQALSEAFSKTICPVAQELNILKEEVPTLRVGVAICHLFEPYSLIRQYAKKAEVYAKGESGTLKQGNALGLSLHIRAGHILRQRLEFGKADDFTALNTWVKMYADKKLPSGLPYRIREVSNKLKRLLLADDVIKAELILILENARNTSGDGYLDKELIKIIQERYENLAAKKGHLPDTLQDLAEELIMARWLSARTAGEVTYK